MSTISRRGFLRGLVAVGATCAYPRPNGAVVSFARSLIVEAPPALILPASGLTLATLDRALWEFYLPGLRAQLNQESPLLARIGRA